MTLEERTRLSYYQELAPINATHEVMLVRHSESGGLFVKKTLTNYQLSIFQQLMAHPFPGLPRILEAVEDGDTLIVIESYLPGQTLQELLDGGTRYTLAQTLDIGMDLCRILAPLHAAGIIHRDIKPSNVMVGEDGSVHLLDLDAAKIYKPEESRDTRLIGTKGYAAPEQYGFGSSDPRTDIYALGVLMNVLLTGSFPGDKMPEDSLLRAMVERCTRLEPGNRYASVTELMTALEAIAGSLPSESRSKGVPGARRFLPPGFRSGNPRNMLIGGLYYLLMLGVLIAGSRDQSVSFTEKIFYMLFALAAFLGAPAIFCNYMGILDRTGISRKEPASRRYLACIGLYLLLLLAVVALGKVLQSIFP